MRALPKRLLVLGTFVLVLLGSRPIGSVAADQDPTTLAPAVAALWVQLDGRVHYQAQGQTWILGPALRAVALEPYHEASGGARTVYYFDKARVEVTDPASSDPRSLSLGLLVREMVLGVLQVGDRQTIPVAPAQIPLAGDLEQSEAAPTYASLRDLVSSSSGDLAHRAPNRLGEPVTALLTRDGVVQADAVPSSPVRFARYDEAFGHNIPDVFWGWLQQQPWSWIALTGYPISEPYWVRTRVAGQERLVLVQAFERRILTYDPANPPGWQVEWGNVGLHYRLWRGYSTPLAAKDQALASGIPFGEAIVRAARAENLDPYLLAALAAVASQFDPLAESGNGRGLLLVPNLHDPYPLDPTLNARRGAQRLATLIAASGLERGLASYLAAAGSSAQPSDVLAQMDRLRQRFPAGAPLPAGPTLREVGRGHAAYYAPGYDVAWWERTLQLYVGWGQAVPGAAPDPNGYYCVHPDYRPGQRLLLVANGTALWCTIGDMVAPAHVASWRSRWVIELSWPTFLALGLDRNNDVTVWGP